MYHQLLLLAFRPFLIFRGRLQYNNARRIEEGNHNAQMEIPSWLDATANRAIQAALDLIGLLDSSYKIHTIFRVSQEVFQLKHYLMVLGIPISYHVPRQRMFHLNLRLNLR